MRSSFIAVFGLWTALACGVVSASGENSPSVWPEQTSDLPSDPNLVTGTLPNGLRYLIYPNREPKDRIALRLVVAVGSLEEREEERGMAHFVEHMLFRGTKKYPGDSLTTELQRMGVGFGPENTAFTYFDHTDYHLDLPNPRPETLRRGLEVFRQYSDSALFDAKFIETERGVVLSEKAMRDTPDYRTYIANQAFLWPTSRYALRPVIGTVETVKAFTREQLVSFYDAWYRPERMALIVTGNIDANEAVALIHETFESLAARGPAREMERDFTPGAAERPTVCVASDPTFIGVTLTFQHPRPAPRRSLTRDERAEALQRNLAFSIFQRRLQHVTREAGDTLIAPSAVVSSPFQGWHIASFSAAARLPSWKILASKIEQEHRRAIQFGFADDELDRARKDYLEAFDLAVRMKTSRLSDQIAAELIGTVLSYEPFLAIETRRDEVKAVLDGTTAKDCREAFRRAWETQPLHVFVTINSAFRIAELDVAQVLNESRKIEVRPRDSDKIPAFAYTNFGEKGTLAKEQKVPDLDIRMAEYSNGARVNFKATTFESDLVRFQVRVGHGMLSLPENKPGLALLARYAFMNGGLWKHSAPELGEIFSGRSLQVGFYVDTDAYSFYGYCSRRDLLLAMQLIAAYCSDARFDSTAMRDAESSYNTVWSDCETRPGGPIKIVAERVLTGDRRFGIPWRKEFSDCSMADLALYLTPELKEGPVEIGLVGDTTWEEVSEAVAVTFGALPKRHPRVEHSGRELPAIKGERKKPYVYLTPNRLSQAALSWYWPVADLSSIHQERRCSFLGEVMMERLRVRLREELGAAYAPTATFVTREGLPAVSYFLIYAEVQTDKATQVAEIVKKEIEALCDQGITEDEFTRVKTPFVRSREDDVRSNDYWCYRVLREPQRRPELLDAARDRLADTAAITREEVQKMARHYLGHQKPYFLVAEPGQAHKWK